MAVVTMMLGSMCALLMTVICWIFGDIGVAQAATIYFSTGGICMLLPYIMAQTTLPMTKKVSLAK